MPKIVITDDTLPIALHELDKWTGKLTWTSYAAKLASAIGVDTISRHTLLGYPEIKHAFETKKIALKTASESSSVSDDVTIELLKSENETLKSKLKRLESQVQLYKEQFIRWQYNLYMMPGVDMEKLDREKDKPLPTVDRISG